MWCFFVLFEIFEIFLQHSKLIILQTCLRQFWRKKFWRKNFWRKNCSG